MELVVISYYSPSFVEHYNVSHSLRQDHASSLEKILLNKRAYSPVSLRHGLAVVNLTTETWVVEKI